MGNQVRSRIWRVARLAVALVLVSGAAGCIQEDSGQARTLHRGNGGDPGSLDPLLADDVHAFRVLADIYEGLVTIDAKGQIGPGVAMRWEVSDDGLTWRFELRTDARWSDGTRVVADDFVRSFRRLATAEADSSYEFLLSPVVGFDAINRGAAPLSSLGVKALSEATVEFTLREPTPHWLSVLSLAVSYPTPPREGLYNGAFVLAERRINEWVRLRRNRAYRDAANVAIDEVVYHSIVEPQTELARYLAGDLHIAINLPVNSVDQLRAERPTELSVAPSLGLYYLAFDLSQAPTGLTSVRQALTMAIDRDRLVALLGRGEQAAWGVVPDGMPDYDAARYSWRSQPLQERRDRARALLIEAGYNEQTPLELTYLYDTGDVHERVALIVADMWQSLGVVQVTLEKREWQYFLDSRDKRDAWDVMRFAWNGDYLDATTFLDLFQSGNELNLPGYASDPYDTLLADALSSPDRAMTLARAEQLLIEDYPIAPLYFYTSKHLVRPDVQGFEANLVDRHLSRYLSLE